MYPRTPLIHFARAMRKTKFEFGYHTRVKIVRMLLAFFLVVSLGCQTEQQTKPAEQTKDDSSQQIETTKSDAPASVPETDSNAAKVSNDELKELLEKFGKLATSAPSMSGGMPPEMEQCTKQLLELASANPKLDQAFEALQTVCRVHRFGAKRKSAFQQLQTHHLDNPLIGKLCQTQSSNPGPDVERLIVQASEKASDRKARALAIYARSRLYDFSRRTQEQFKSGGEQVEEMRKSMPAETWDYFMNFEYDDKLTRELLQKLLDDYSDVEIDGQEVKKIATDAIKYLDQTKK